MKHEPYMDQSKMNQFNPNLQPPQGNPNMQLGNLNNDLQNPSYLNSYNNLGRTNPLPQSYYPNIPFNMNPSTFNPQSQPQPQPSDYKSFNSQGFLGIVGLLIRPN
jgi:hypothetical protein